MVDTFDDFLTPEQLREKTQPKQEEDEFAGFGTYGPPSLLEGNIAVTKRAVGAAAQAAPLLPFTIAGAQGGAMLGAATGPFAPVGVPVGAALGGAAGAVTGFFAGQSMASDLERLGLAYDDLNDLPPELRPYGAAGEVLGGSIPFMGAPLAAAQQGFRFAGTWAGRLANRVIDFAATAPRRFLAVEVSSAGSAAIAGGASEAAAPGETLPRVGAELVAGFFNPLAVVQNTTARAMSKVSSSVQRLTPSGRRTQAAKYLKEFVEAGGEDPETLARMLRTEDIPELAEATAAQRTGSPRLAAFEAELKELNRRFGVDAAQAAQDSFDGFSRAIHLLRGTGDMQAMRTAAELRAEHFRTMIDMRLRHAMTEAIEGARGISADTPAARAQLSKQAQEALDRSMQRTREVESELWGRVPQDLPVEPRSVFARYSLLRGQMLPREQVPAVLAGTIEDLEEATPEMLTSGFFLKLRRRALSLAREAAGRGDHNEARMYGEIAEATLDDLTRAGAASPSASSRTAFDEARAFSRELNDAYTRTFAGKALASQRTGAERIPPEVMLRRALATGDELGELQLRELEEAVSFLPQRGIDDPVIAEEATGDVALMMDIQERYLRLAAAQAIDPETGRVSSGRLAKFIADSEGILDRFPHVREVLQHAVDTEQGLAVVERQATRANKFLQQRAAVARVLKVDSPADAVRGAITSARPEENLRAIARLAVRGGRDAVEGLRAAVWDDAIRSATGPNNRLMLRDLTSALNDPIRPGLPSMVRLMAQEGIIPVSVVADFDRLISRAQQVVAVTETRAVGEQIMGRTDFMFDLFIRFASTRAASLAQRAAGSPSAGESLVLTQRASHAGRQLFGKVPEINLQQLLANAMRGDPIRPGAPRFSLLASLLEDNPTPKAYTAMALRMHAYMLQAGLTAARDEGPIDRSAQPVLVPSEEEPQAAPAPTMPEPAGEEGETDDFSDFQQQGMMQPNQELETAMKNTIEAEEGRRAGVYLDHLGNRTIGVGFNLERDDAEQLLSSVGADFAAILDGSQQLTEEQIDQLYQITFQEAVEAAGRVVPGFEELSEDQQHVLVDMAFQLGERGLSKFDKMLTAIKAGDFQTAAMELLDSRYAKQVPSRARRNADRLKQEAV